MADIWPRIPLDSVVRFQEGPGILAKDFHPDGVPLVRLAGLGGYEVTLNKCNYLDPSFVAKKWDHFRLKKGDILISTSASFGRPAVVGAEAEGAIFYTGIIRFRSMSSELNEGYLKSFLGSRAFMLQAEAQASGSVISHFGPSHLRRMEIPLPPLKEQQNIAYVHSTLDDKIELNRWMNETLEAMARAIFKDWFVDFGPTRARMEGREPCLAPEIWNLFPDRLDAEGKPEGWEQGTLVDIADSPRRGVSPADVAEDTPYIGLEHMPRRSIALSEWEGAGKVTSNKSIFKKGEFLFGKLRPYFHKVGFALLDGICSTDIVVVIPRAPNWGAFTLACLSTDEFVDYTDQTSTGTKMPRTGWNTMGQYEVCIPSEQIAHAFQSIAQTLFDRVSTNIHESRTLAQTRDFILPKLMSGEIRLREAEKIAGEAVA